MFYKVYRLTNQSCIIQNIRFSLVNFFLLFQAKPEDTLDLCQIINNDLAKTVSSHPNRFVGLGTLPMQAPELAIQEMKRCKHELGKRFS